MLVICH